MDLIECIEKRRSVRSFTDEAVPEEVLKEMLRIGNLAPSAGNLQARDFVVVRDRSTIDRLIASSPSHSFISQAPVVIVCCVNHDRIMSYGPRGRNLYCIQDSAAAIENMLLYIAAHGYGACWIGAFDEDAVADALNLPDHAHPVALLPIGRPKKNGHQPARLKLEQVVHWEGW